MTRRRCDGGGARGAGPRRAVTGRLTTEEEAPTMLRGCFRRCSLRCCWRCRHGPRLTYRKSPRPAGSRPGWSRIMAFPSPRWRSVRRAAPSLDLRGQARRGQPDDGDARGRRGRHGCAGLRRGARCAGRDVRLFAGQGQRRRFGPLPDRKPRYRRSTCCGRRSWRRASTRMRWSG